MSEDGHLIGCRAKTDMCECAPIACSAWCNDDEHFYACPNYVMPELERKRRALQTKLDGVQVDATKLKDRTPRRSVEVLAHDIRRKLLEQAEKMLDHNDLDNAVTLINAAKGLA